MKCSACGHPVQQGVGFCVGCGQSLNSESDSTSNAGRLPSGHEPNQSPGEAAAEEGLDRVPGGHETSTGSTVPNAAGGLRSLKTTLAAVGVIIVAGFGFMAFLGAGEGETAASGSSESSDLGVSAIDVPSSSPSAVASPDASAVPAVGAVIPLPDFNSSSQVRDNVLVYDSYSGLEVQVAGEAGNLTFPAPAVAGGLELTRHIQDVTGSGGDPRLAVLLETRKPASGLEPESYSALLRTYTDGSAGATAEAVVSGIEHSSFGSVSIYGSTDGSITLADSTYSHPAVRFFAAETLQETGSVAAEYIGQQSGTIFVSPKDNDCEVSAWSPSSGTLLWTRDYGLSVKYSSCTVEATTEGITVEVNGESDYFSVIDPQSGDSTVQFADASAVRFDPGAPIVAVEYSGSEPSETALRIYDAESWQPLLDVSHERFNALRMQEYYLYGGKLYMTNTDEQPVLDAATGAKLSETWSVRPIKPVGTGWTLVKNESDSSYSLHANKDGVYNGPWW